MDQNNRDVLNFLGLLALCVLVGFCFGLAVYALITFLQ